MARNLYPLPSGLYTKSCVFGFHHRFKEFKQIYQVQRNKRVTGMQQEMAQAHQIRQSCVRLWKTSQLKLRTQLCQKLPILQPKEEKKDLSWNKVQELQKLQGKNYIRQFSQDK